MLEILTPKPIGFFDRELSHSAKSFSIGSSIFYGLVPCRVHFIGQISIKSLARILTFLNTGKFYLKNKVCNLLTHFGGSEIMRLIEVAEAERLEGRASCGWRDHSTLVETGATFSIFVSTNVIEFL